MRRVILLLLALASCRPPSYQQDPFDAACARGCERWTGCNRCK